MWKGKKTKGGRKYSTVATKKTKEKYGKTTKALIGRYRGKAGKNLVPARSGQEQLETSQRLCPGVVQDYNQKSYETIICKVAILVLFTALLVLEVSSSALFCFLSFVLLSVVISVDRTFSIIFLHFSFMSLLFLHDLTQTFF